MMYSLLNEIEFLISNNTSDTSDTNDFVSKHR